MTNRPSAAASIDVVYNQQRCNQNNVAIVCYQSLLLEPPPAVCMGFMKFFFFCLFSFTPLVCVHTPSGDINSNSYARAYVHPSITAVRVVFENQNAVLTMLARWPHAATMTVNAFWNSIFILGGKKHMSTPLVKYSCFSYGRLTRRIHDTYSMFIDRHHIVHALGVEFVIGIVTE